MSTYFYVSPGPGMYKIAVPTAASVIVRCKQANQYFPLPTIKAMKLNPGTDGTLTLESRFHPDDDWAGLGSTKDESEFHVSGGGDAIVRQTAETPMDAIGEMRITATVADGVVYIIT